MCFFPQKAYRSPSGGITFVKNSSYIDLPVTLPCGQCIGCRLERSRVWATRCVHEASLYTHNCFITLTYDDDHVPLDLSLNKKHFQLFMKRLRKKFGSGIRFYQCGEYGTDFGRPHYHAIIFNHDFPDRVFLKETHGSKLYTSKILEDLWPFGFSSVGDVTFDSAAYVARYIMKKITGDAADTHYFEPSTGVYRVPEYTNMSRRPGIASGWFDLYHGETYRDDFCISNGHKTRPPKFYDNKYELLEPINLARIKSTRKRKARVNIDNNTPSRLKVRHSVQIAKLDQLQRKLK